MQKTSFEFWYIQVVWRTGDLTSRRREIDLIIISLNESALAFLRDSAPPREIFFRPHQSHHLPQGGILLYCLRSNSPPSGGTAARRILGIYVFYAKMPPRLRLIP